MAITIFLGGFNMAYLVAHCEKYKSDNLGGVQRHEDRLNSKYSNENIDTSRIKDNYYPLGEKQATTYKERIQAVLDKYNIKPWNAETRTGVKKDSVLMCGWVFGAGGELFANMSRERQQEFFCRVCDFVADKIGGKDKLINAVVHFDETTPHLHLSYVPVLEAKEGKTGYRLSCKDMNNRQFLRAIQNDLPKYLRGFGFDIQRGIENSEKKHKTPRQFKQEQAQKQEELKPVLEALQELQTSEHIKTGLFRSGAEYVKIPVNLYHSIEKSLKEHGATLQSILDLEARITKQDKIKEQKRQAVEELKAVKQELTQVKAEREQEYTRGFNEGQAKARQELTDILLQARKMLEQTEAEAQSRKQQEQEQIKQFNRSLADVVEKREQLNEENQLYQKALQIAKRISKRNIEIYNKWLDNGELFASTLERVDKRKNDYTI